MLVTSVGTGGAKGTFVPAMGTNSNRLSPHYSCRLLLQPPREKPKSTMEVLLRARIISMALDPASAVATLLTAGGLAAQSVDILFQVCLPPSQLRAPVSLGVSAVSSRTLVNNAGLVELLIACSNKQVVGSRPILSDTGLRIEREMRNRVCDRLELMCQREGMRIDECGGRLDESHPILTVKTFFKSEVFHRQRSHLIEVIGALSIR